MLPAEYVAEYVDLGYAVTAHRAQGITVDTSHVVVTPSTTRENLYVSMSRGRESNIAYVALDQPDDSHSTPEPDDVTARTVLFGVLNHSGASMSAHQTMEAEYAIHGGIDRLAAELETIAADAQRDRFVELLRRSGLTPEQHEAVVAVRARSARSWRPFAERRPSTTTSRSWFPESLGSTRSTMLTTSRQSSGTGSSRPPPPRPAAADCPTPDRRAHPGTAGGDVRRAPPVDRRARRAHRGPGAVTGCRSRRRRCALVSAPGNAAHRTAGQGALDPRGNDRRRVPRSLQDRQ